MKQGYSLLAGYELVRRMQRNARLMNAEGGGLTAVRYFGDSNLLGYGR